MDLEEAGPVEGTGGGQTRFGGGGRGGVDIDRLDDGAGGPGLPQQLDALDDKASFRLAGTAAAGEAPQSLYRLVPEGERSSEGPEPGQAVADRAAEGPDRASRATSTSAAKVASSRTARSASTLRSTSTPAVRSPAIRRL